MTDALSLSALITTGDLDDIDEQVAMFACLLALFVMTVVAVIGVLLCLLFGAIYLWGRLALHHGPS
ncbi:MAG: hypothetical protein ACR2QH_04430 [Geminicoccaceae bacterium]